MIKNREDQGKYWSIK